MSSVAAPPTKRKGGLTPAPPTAEEAWKGFIRPPDVLPGERPSEYACRKAEASRAVGQAIRAETAGNAAFLAKIRPFAKHPAAVVAALHGQAEGGAAAGSRRRKGHAFGRGELVNRAAIRRYVLAIAGKTGRGGVVTHVGASVYADCERVVREHLAGLVHRHPSGFRTLEAH